MEFSYTNLNEEFYHVLRYDRSNLYFEIRNHLNTITVFSELLHDKSLNHPKFNNYSQVIISSCNHLSELVEDIIKNPFIQSEQLEVLKLDCYLTDFFNGIYNNFKKNSYYLKKRDISFKFIIPEELKSAKFRLATHEINIILYELLSNAFKYTTNGEIVFGVESYQNSLRFFVKDTGIGISKSVLTDIFRTTSINSHLLVDLDLKTKLPGLSTIKKLTDRINGELEVISRIDKGSEFYLHIPIKIDFNEALRYINDKTNCFYNLNAKYHLLVIGDIDTYNVFNFISSKDHIAISFAEDEAQAIEKFNTGMQYDMIFIDITNNLKSQINLCSKCKEINKEAHIIALKNITTDQLISPNLQNSCTKVILKPIPYTKLSQLMKSLIE